MKERDWSALKFTTGKEGRRFSADLEKDLRVDETKINAELAEQPALFAWWAVQHEEAKAEFDAAKSALDLVEAELYVEHRDAESVNGAGRVTERSVDARVKQDKRYEKALTRLRESKKQSGVLNVAREAMAQRQEMLIALASNLRRELDVDLSRKVEAIERARTGRR